MNNQNKSRQLYSFSYSLTPKLATDAVEEARTELIEEFIKLSDFAEANAVIAQIKAL